MFFDRIGPMVALSFLLVLASASAAQAAPQGCEPEWVTTLGNPGIADGYVAPMLAWDDGSGEQLYVGGSFSRVGGISAESVAAYDPDSRSWSPLGRGLASGFLTALTPFDDGNGDLLMVGGFFANAEGLPGTSGLAAWNGSTFASVGGGTDGNGAVWSLESSDYDGTNRLYIGGGFASYGGVTASCIASWDGRRVAPVGTGQGVQGSFNPFVTDIQAWDDGNGPALYIVGRYDTVDGVAAPVCSRFKHGAWERVGAGLRVSSGLRHVETMTLYDDGNGEALYVAGSPFIINGVGGEHSVARWDGNTWTPVGQNVGGRVTKLIGWDDGDGPRLYLGGTATPDIQYFAVLDGNTWVPAAGGVWDPPVPPSNFPSVFGLAEWNGDLLVGGNFTRVGPDKVTSNGIVMRTTCASPCTGRETLDITCKPRGGDVYNLVAKIKRGPSGGKLTVRADGDPRTDRVVTLDNKGRGKAKLKKLAGPQHGVEIVECGVLVQVRCL
ncbi:MAG: hypothetical protein C4547_13240 [Phycisphaerales bacterium]|nr:MAG: hypothetical protein C4547_13240 [Phycisphaerales bacterium]